MEFNFPSMDSQGERSEAPKFPKHTTLISKLEKNSGNWMLSDDHSLYKYKGFWYVQMFLEGILEAQEIDPSEYNLSSSDVIICSSMKSGTTWLKALAFSTVTRTRSDPFSDNHLLSTAGPHDLIPYIELDFGRHRSPRGPDLPLLSTHMPYSALPDQIKLLGCKIVYICRNPKDVFISMWHFIQKFRPVEDPLPLEKACDLFCTGISPYGSYWDHVLEYWKASVNHPEKVMFLKYEDMMIDTEFYVNDLARFMGYPFSSEEDKKGVAKRIVEMCRFESLSNLEVNKNGKHREERKGGEDLRLANSIFFRKAKVNDWRNYLSEDMASKFDQITVEKLDNSGLTL